VANLPVTEWAYLASLPIAAAAIFFGLYALAFRKRARGGWPTGFLVLAWLFALSNLAMPARTTEPNPVLQGHWTQESTRSASKGPWLEFSPSGSRFCRAPDGTIVTVYPPGVKPEASTADPACLIASVVSVEQL